MSDCLVFIISKFLRISSIGHTEREKLPHVGSRQVSVNKYILVFTEINSLMLIIFIELINHFYIIFRDFLNDLTDSSFRIKRRLPESIYFESDTCKYRKYRSLCIYKNCIVSIFGLKFQIF